MCTKFYFQPHFCWTDFLAYVKLVDKEKFLQIKDFDINQIHL